MPNEAKPYFLIIYPDDSIEVYEGKTNIPEEVKRLIVKFYTNLTNV